MRTATSLIPSKSTILFSIEHFHSPELQGIDAAPNMLKADIWNYPKSKYTEINDTPPPFVCIYCNIRRSKKNEKNRYNLWLGFPTETTETL